jgi:MFS transporter, MHS family, proline/betaine transporter
MAIETATGVTSSARPGLRGVIIAATIGNVLEWFDFLVYGFFAVTIAEVFFPASNPTVSLLITFGTFGLAYVVRPVGAVIVGTYTDRAGRKAGLILSIGATIGIAAPIIITVARLLQGFSVGGEFGSAVAILVEHGGERKGFSASWQWATTGIVSVIVSLFGVTLTTQLSHEQLVDWGWRIPYVFGLLVGPAGLYIARASARRPTFSRPRNTHRCRSAICCADIRFRCCWRPAPPSFRTAPTTCSSMSRPTGSRRFTYRPIPALSQRWWAVSFLPSSRSLPGTGRTGPRRVRASC